MTEDFYARIARIQARDAARPRRKAPIYQTPAEKPSPLMTAVSWAGTITAVALLAIVITGGNLVNPAQAAGLLGNTTSVEE